MRLPLEASAAQQPPAGSHLGSTEQHSRARVGSHELAVGGTLSGHSFVGPAFSERRLHTAQAGSSGAELLGASQPSQMVLVVGDAISGGSHACSDLPVQRVHHSTWLSAILGRWWRRLGGGGPWAPSQIGVAPAVGHSDSASRNITDVADKMSGDEEGASGGEGSAGQLSPQPSRTASASLVLYPNAPTRRVGMPHTTSLHATPPMSATPDYLLAGAGQHSTGWSAAAGHQPLSNGLARARLRSVASEMGSSRANTMTASLECATTTYSTRLTRPPTFSKQPHSVKSRRWPCGDANRRARGGSTSPIPPAFASTPFPPFHQADCWHQAQACCPPLQLATCLPPMRSTAALSRARCGAPRGLHAAATAPTA